MTGNGIDNTIKAQAEKLTTENKKRMERQKEKEEAALQKLSEMGFQDTVLSTAVLRMCNYDVDKAVEQLLANLPSGAAQAGVANSLGAMSVFTSDRQHWVSKQQQGLEKDKLFAVDVSTQSDEFDAIAARFFQTMPDASIDRLERVENGYVHESFKLQASTLAKQMGADWDSTTMRQMLFHGTEAVDPIVNAEDGHAFLPLLSGTSTGAIFGDGCYFARDSKYSDDYANTLPSGQKQMLVVDVLVGRWSLGQKNMKMPPLLPGEKYRRFNSLVNKVDNPSIFVVQHSNQAYPAYLITYHH